MHTQIHIHVCIYVHTRYVYMHTYVYTHTHKYVHTHTLTHTYIFRFLLVAQPFFLPREPFPQCMFIFFKPFLAPLSAHGWQMLQVYRHPHNLCPFRIWYSWVQQNLSPRDHPGLEHSILTLSPSGCQTLEGLLRLSKYPKQELQIMDQPAGVRVWDPKSSSLDGKSQCSVHQSSPHPPLTSFAATLTPARSSPHTLASLVFLTHPGSLALAVPCQEYSSLR